MELNPANHSAGSNIRFLYTDFGIGKTCDLAKVMH